MALDDRERSFEKALVRRLRASAAAGRCPDAETLGAYHERSLTAEEMNSWKEHASACSNCQEILAQLGATDEIQVAAGEWQKAAASVSLRRMAKQTRALHWRWLAPVGALAAASLLVWVAVHERQPAKVMPSAKIEIAENRPTAPQPPAATLAIAEQGKAEKPSSSKPGDSATGRARAADADELNKRGAEPARNEILTLSPGVVAKTDRKDLEVAVTAQAPEVTAEGSSVGGATDAAKLKRADELSGENRAVSNLVQLQRPAPAPTGGPAALPQMESKTPKKAAPEAATPETLALSSGSRDTSAFRMAKNRSPQAVPAPGGKVIWRVGIAGLIEQSTDGGLTWTPQTSGTTADLFLGSAPSEQVCWVIGNGGTILRTPDRGAHWISVASPISQNLYRIRASDTLHAAVWDASGRNSFRTEDGGVTWTQVSNQ